MLISARDREEQWTVAGAIPAKSEQEILRALDWLRWPGRKLANVEAAKFSTRFAILSIGSAGPICTINGVSLAAYAPANSLAGASVREVKNLAHEL